MKENTKHNKVGFYSGIDVFKLIAAVLIVLLHSIETTYFVPSEIKFVLTRFAVPFFFICSGYFFALGITKNKDCKSYFIHYEKKLLTVFCIWNIIYFPVVFNIYIKEYNGTNALKVLALILRRVFVIGAGPYWYLLALIISTAIIFVCHEKKLNKLLLLLVIIGFILQLCYSNFQSALGSNAFFSMVFKLTKYVFSYEFNFIMYGIPFMGLGYFIYLKKINFKNSINIPVFILSTLLRFVEFNLSVWIPDSDFLKDNQISFVFIIQAISFFMLARNYQPNISKEKSCTLRQLSSFIYFLHAIILYNILNPLLSIITDANIYHGIWIVLKILITLAICTALFFVIKKINNKHLNILINA